MNNSQDEMQITNDLMELDDTEYHLDLPSTQDVDLDLILLYIDSLDLRAIEDVVLYLDLNELLLSLNYAAHNNRGEIVVFLIQYIIDNSFDLIDDGGSHDLSIISARKGHISLLKYLISNYSDYYLAYGKDSLNQLVLHAVKGGHLDIVRFLIEGVEIYNGEIIRADDYEEIAYYAGRHGEIKILEEMIAYNIANWDEISEIAADRGHINIIKEILRVEHRHNQEVRNYIASIAVNRWDFELFNLMGKYNITNTEELIYNLIDNDYDDEVLDFISKGNHVSWELVVSIARQNSNYITHRKINELRSNLY